MAILPAAEFPMLVSGVVPNTNGQSGDEQSLERQLIDRLRFILAIIASMAAVFVADQLVTADHPLGAFLAFRVTLATLSSLGFFVLRRRSVEAWAWPLTTAIVAFAYLFVAANGVVSPTGEYITTAFLFVGAALVTATVLPWGVGPQCFTVAVGAVALAAAVRWKDGTFAALATDPAAVIMMGFVLSVVLAREFERYRSAHRRELEERRRAEVEVRQLNVALERAHDGLERRVRERTAELAAVVDSLRTEIAERRLAEERLALALWATDLGMWDWNVKTNAVVYDQRGAQMLGYAPDTAERNLQVWQDLIHPEDRPSVMKALNDHVYEHRSPHYEVEHRLRTADGDYRWISARGRVVEWAADGSAARVIGTSWDITDRKRVEEQMHRQQAELAHVLRLQTIEGIAAELAHEINQPLGAIANFANGLAARLRKGAPDTAMLDAAEQIGKQALRAASVLQRLRDFIRKEPPCRLPCDINRLVSDAAHLIKPDARRHQITLRLALGADLPAVAADGIQVEQVLINLLRNGVEAIAHAERRRGELHIGTGLSATGEVQVLVHDTGRGIPPSIRERLFEPFFTTKRDGLGMALSISRSIIVAHGGHLEVLTNSHDGATVRFTLPRFQPDEP